MSRRLLLASGGTAGVIPDPLPGGDPPPPPSPIWPNWAPTADTTLMAIRPHGRRAGYASVGITGATHTDLNTAATAAKGQAESVGATGSGYWDGKGPDYRYDLVIGPGTYDGSMGGGDWGCYVSSSGDPTDTIIKAGDGGEGVIHSFGSQYIEGLTLKAYSTDGDASPKYPWHITGGPVTVAANCIFDATEAPTGTSVGGGNRTQGLAGKDSSVLIVFYKCTFITNPASGPTGFNMHGATGQQFPETCVFIDCTTIGLTSIGSTGDRDPQGNPSRLYVLNLTADEHMTTITADGNTEVYTDTSLTVTGSPPATYRDVTTWLMPTDGLSDVLTTYYYPSTLGSEPATFTPTVTDAAPMAPVVGRTYFTRVRPTSAMRITTSGFTCTTAAGSYGIDHLPADTPYVRDEPVSTTRVTPNTTLAAGVQSRLHYYYWTRYPGDNGIWVKMEFDNAAARINGSAQLPGITDCYYTDDGTTLVPVTAGTPHPLPFIRAT